MAGLAILSYIDCDADFTSLIQQGYYTETQRPIYVARRIVGHAIVSLLFVLPLICFLVIPITTRLVRMNRLRWSGIVLRLVIGWIAISLIGWLWNLIAVVPPYSLPSFLESTTVPILVFGLPIPVAALLFFPFPQREA